MKRLEGEQQQLTCKHHQFQTWQIPYLLVSFSWAQINLIFQDDGPTGRRRKRGRSASCRPRQHQQVCSSQCKASLKKEWTSYHQGMWLKFGLSRRGESEWIHCVGKILVRTLEYLVVHGEFMSYTVEMKPPWMFAPFPDYWMVFALINIILTLLIPLPLL